MVKQILILLTNNFINSHTTKAREFLGERISEEMLTEVENITNAEKTHTLVDILDNDFNNDILKYFLDLSRDAELVSTITTEKNNVPNPFKNKSILLQFLNILSLLPMWTNVLSSRLPIFHEAVNDLQFRCNLRAENLDARLRKFLEDFKLPSPEQKSICANFKELRVENFLIGHSEFLKIILQENRKSLKAFNIVHDTKDISLIHSHLNHIAEWRGKASMKNFQVEEIVPVPEESSPPIQCIEPNKKVKFNFENRNLDLKNKSSKQSTGIGQPVKKKKELQSLLIHVIMLCTGTGVCQFKQEQEEKACTIIPKWEHPDSPKKFD